MAQVKSIDQENFAKLSPKKTLLFETLKKLPSATKLSHLVPIQQSLLAQIPRSPPGTGMLYFVREQFKQKPLDSQLKAKEALSQFVAQWKSLPKEEQAAYSQQAKNAWDDYQQSITAFLRD